MKHRLFLFHSILPTVIKNIKVLILSYFILFIMDRIRLIGLMIGLLGTLGVLGQDSADTLRAIDGVEVITDRLIQNSTGKSVIHIPAKAIRLHNDGSLNELFSKQSSIYLKTYGNVGTTGVSIRGTSTDHTAILWNGFNIYSPLSGEMNLFMLSNFLLDDVSLQKGSGGALFGSGAVGGSIHLNTKPDYTKGFGSSLLLSYGSFDNLLGGLKLNYSNGKYSSKLRVLYNAADNNYPYINHTKVGAPEEEMQNSAYDRKVIVQENYFKIDKKNSIAAFFWYDDIFYQTPPSMMEGSKVSFIDNEGKRAAVVWNHVSGKMKINARSGIFNEHMFYNDSNINLKANHKYLTSISEGEFSYFHKWGIFSTGINNTYVEVKSDNYGQKEKQNRFSVFASYKKEFFEDLTLNVIVRDEIVDSIVGKPKLSVGYDWQINKFKIKGNVSQAYKIPDFNDLFWKGGFASGNPDLVPEEGWTFDFGGDYKETFGAHGIRVGAVAFVSEIKNLINWTPVGAIWQPVNVDRVLTRGIENSVMLRTKIGVLKAEYNMSYTYTRSTQKGLDPVVDAALVNKQLEYTPLQQMSNNLWLSYRKVEFVITRTYLGKRFADKLNKVELAPTLLTDISIGMKHHFNQFSANLRFKANNLFNVDYQNIQYYAMPGRNFGLSLIIDFKNKN